MYLWVCCRAMVLFYNHGVISCNYGFVIEPWFYFITMVFFSYDYGFVVEPWCYFM